MVHDCCTPLKGGRPCVDHLAAAQALGLEPSTYLFSSLCNGYALVGAPDRVRQVIRQAQGLGVPVTPHYFTALVKSFGTSVIHAQMPLSVRTPSTALQCVAAGVVLTPACHALSHLRPGCGIQCIS